MEFRKCNKNSALSEIIQIDPLFKFLRGLPTLRLNCFISGCKFDYCNIDVNLKTYLIK